LADSPESFAKRCIAVGETPKGNDTGFPKTIVEIVLFDTSQSILGFINHL
jgi:hypothetical protein